MTAVMFDMDGVLVDSERLWAEREADDIFPRAVSEPVDPDDVAGMNVVDLYHHLTERYGTTVDEAAFVAMYDDAADEVYGSEAALLSGFAELAAELRERGVPLALVSSSPERWIARVLERFDLGGTFEAVVSAEHVERGKPAPDVYHHAADLLGVDSTAAVAVEDSNHGVQAASEAGLSTVGFARGDRAPPTGADAVAGDAESLRRVLERF